MNIHIVSMYCSPFAWYRTKRKVFSLVKSVPYFHPFMIDRRSVIKFKEKEDRYWSLLGSLQIFQSSWACLVMLLRKSGTSSCFENLLVKLRLMFELIKTFCGIPFSRTLSFQLGRLRHGRSARKPHWTTIYQLLPQKQPRGTKIKYFGYKKAKKVIFLQLTQF